VDIVRRYWLYLVLLAALIPFLGKAYHIDDPVFIAIADQIRTTPLHPHDATMHWGDRVRRIGEFSANPPLHGYFLALARATGPDAEWWLHLWMLPVSLLGLYGALRLGRGDPLVGALWLSGPAVLVSATNLMPDIPAAALTALGAALFLEEKYAWAGLALALGGLERFNTAAALPGLAFYAVAKRRWRALPALVLPCAAMAGWLVIQREAWGAIQSLGFDTTFLSQRALASVVIVATAGVFPLLLVAVRWKPHEWITGLLAGGATALACWTPELKTYAAPRLPEAALAALGAFLLVAHLARAIRVWVARREPLDLALWGWVFGALLVPLFYIHVSAKYLSVAAAPLAWLGVRASVLPRRLAWVGVALWLGWSSALNVADFLLAGVHREMARTLVRPRTKFVGSHGFQWYAERAGGVPMGYDRPPAPGETVLLLEQAGAFQRSMVLSLIPAGQIRRVEMRSSPWPLRTFNFRARASFYSYSYGPMPYAISSAPLEVATFVQVVHVGPGKP